MKSPVRLNILLVAVMVLAMGAAASGQMRGRPPGWRGMSPKDQVAWGEEFEKAKKSVQEKVAVAEGFSEAASKNVLASLPNMTAAGVPVADAQALVGWLLDKGFGGAEIVAVTKTMSRGVREGLKASRINYYIRDRVNEGLRGEALTAEINKAIDRRMTP
jgi:hypothetical protein